MSVSTIDSTVFRKVLGHYPTGVCAVTSSQADGTPLGMTVGSFTSVSLEPPLVAFFPDRRSTTWPKIESAGRFCVNVLAANQQEFCRLLAAKADNKFEAIPYKLSQSGLPILEGVVAWIDCDLFSIHEAGDHYIAVGHVRSLDIEAPGKPLLFFQGGYGHFVSFDSHAAV